MNKKCSVSFWQASPGSLELKQWPVFIPNPNAWLSWEHMQEHSIPSCISELSQIQKERANPCRNHLPLNMNLSLSLAVNLRVGFLLTFSCPTGAYEILVVFVFSVSARTPLSFLLQWIFQISKRCCCYCCYHDHVIWILNIAAKSPPHSASLSSQDPEHYHSSIWETLIGLMCIKLCTGFWREVLLGYEG